MAWQIIVTKLFLSVMEVFLPFIALLVISRRFEKEFGKPIASFYFYIASICVVASLIWGQGLIGAPSIEERLGYQMFINQILLLVGVFFAYLFLIKLRAHIEETNVYDTLTQFLKSSLLPIIILLIFLLIINREGYVWVIPSTIISVISILLLSHCYLEVGSFFRRFKTRLWFLVIPASILVWGTVVQIVYNMAMLCFGTVAPEDLGIWVAGDLLTGFAGILATIPSIPLFLQLRNPMPKIEKKKLENPHALSLFLFVTKVADLLGGSTKTILKSSIEGYNERFNGDIKMDKDDQIHLSNLSEEEWPKLLDFLLSTYHQCIGPIAFEIAEQIEGMEEIAEKVKAARIR